MERRRNLKTRQFNIEAKRDEKAQELKNKRHAARSNKFSEHRNLDDKDQPDPSKFYNHSRILFNAFN